MWPELLAPAWLPNFRCNYLDKKTWKIEKKVDPAGPQWTWKSLEYKYQEDIYLEYFEVCLLGHSGVSGSASAYAKIWGFNHFNPETHRCFFSFIYFYFFFSFLSFLIKRASYWRSELKFQLNHHLRRTKPWAKIMTVSFIWTLSYNLVSLVWPESHLNDFLLTKLFLLLLRSETSHLLTYLFSPFCCKPLTLTCET